MAKALMCPPELFNKNLNGKTYIVTGGNSGIGFETAMQLSKQGAKVIIGCRRPAEGQRAVDEIKSKISNANIEFLELDLASLNSVRKFVENFLAKYDQLHGLVNNAGIMNTAFGKTIDGFELQIGTNHFGHFLLTELLIPTLKKSGPSRIAILSSCYHDKAMGREGKINFEDLNFEKRKYDGWTSYAQAKLANLLHAKHLAKQLKGSEVTVASIHPGWVRTNLIRSTMPTWFQDVLLKPVLSMVGMIEPWVGAQTSLFVLLSPDVKDHSGAFFSQTGIYRTRSANKGGWPLKSPNPEANDDLVAEKLYQVSLAAVGLN